MTRKKLLNGFLYYLVASGVAAAFQVLECLVFERPESLPYILGLLLLPGYYGAWMFVPGGVDSLHPNRYLALALLINSLLYGGLLLLLWKMGVRFCRKRPK